MHLSQADSCLACHEKEQGRAGEVVTIYRTSAHYEARVSCDGCHGGDAAQTEKARAHAGDFVANPDATGTLSMCGSCHARPLELFKSGRHFPARRNVPRLDCAECHGVHGIGALAASSGWSGFCVNCHGLEYLPGLPERFQQMLALSDDLRDALRHLKGRNMQPADELMKERREIRHRISEIVHPTDLKGGLERIPDILRSGRSLRERLESQAAGRAK